MTTTAFDGKTVAVTGAAGFLGSRLVQHVAGLRCHILRVIRNPLPPLEPCVSTVTDIVGDVSDAALWEQLVSDADVVFHLAAQTNNAVAAEDPDADLQTNVAPMRHLLTACRSQQRQPAVIFAGTVTQAGIPAILPVDEDAPDAPVTVYDRHKLMAEHELTAAARAGTVFGTTLRLANVYGPGAPGRRSRDVLNRAIRAAVAGETLTVYGTGDFIRDYVFVDDVVAAFMLAATRIADLNARHFVVGSGIGTTIRHAFELVASRVEALTGRSVPVSMTASPEVLSAIDRRNFVADPARFIAATGWRPAYALASGIDRTIEACVCA